MSTPPLKVNVYPADAGGCGYYRLIYPADAVIEAGLLDVTIIPHDDPAARFKMILLDRSTIDGSKIVTQTDVVGLHEPPDADVVVLQRPLQRVLVDTIPHLQRAGIAVVVEVDDDFTLIHPRNAAWAATHPGLSPERNWQHLVRACRMADLVTVSTPALAGRFAPHGRVVVLPNFLPDRDFVESPAMDRRPVNDPPIIGWSGQVESHPMDLQRMGTSVRDLVDEGRARFAVVGTGAGVAAKVGLDEVLASGWVDLATYSDHLAEFDVGVVPLDGSPFNEAKSALKGLQMAAAGVPFVASPTSPYRAIARHGIGIIANRPTDWRRPLSRLVEDVDERHALAERMRSAVWSGWRVREHADEWARAWTMAADNAVNASIKKAHRARVG